MDIVLAAIEEWLKKLLSGSIGSNITGMIDQATMQTSYLSGDIMTSPSSYSPSIWSMITSIADTIIVPIAAMILTAVMCIELISWASDHNNFKVTSNTIAVLLKFVIRLFIGVLLVQNAHEITIGIFDLTGYLVEQSVGVVATGGSLDTAISVESMTTTLIEKDLGYLMGLFFISLLGSVGIWIMSIAIQVILIGRMIEIYLYCSMGSIPYATLMNNETSGIGQNYIKNLFALAFQGFFIIVMVAIYGVLANGITLSDDPLSAIGTMLMLSSVLCISLLKSKCRGAEL